MSGKEMSAAGGGQDSGVFPFTEFNELLASLRSFLGIWDAKILQEDRGESVMPLNESEILSRMIEPLQQARQRIRNDEQLGAIDSYLKQHGGFSQGDWSSGLLIDVLDAFNCATNIQLPPRAPSLLLLKRPGQAAIQDAMPVPNENEPPQEIRQRLVVRCEFLSRHIAEASEYVFRRDGSVFQIKGFGESGSVIASLLGIQQIHRLIRTPNVPVSMEELINIGGTPNDFRPRFQQSNLADSSLTMTTRLSFQPAVDGEGKKQIRARIRSLKQKKVAESMGNSEQRDEYQSELESLETFLSANTGLRGAVRNLNNETDKLRPRVYSSLKTAYKNLRDGGLNELAAHFENSISAEGGGYKYSPEMPRPPEWVT